MTSATVERRTRRTELAHYPSGGQRFLCLGIVVVATIVLYYQFYLAGAVAAGTNGKNGILVDYHMSFTYYVYIAVAGYILGAVASFVTGAADKYGRVNIITVGLFIVAVLCLLIPVADSKVGFAIVFAAIGLVEGVILVATPALIRDFSPQLGRASAMGFWTLGPVLGSLVVSIQISSTSDTTPWHNQYVAAGIVGIVVAIVSALFLRELAPQLRDQVMVSARDRQLVEARAKGIDVEASLAKPFRQMLRPDVIGSAFAISVFLIIYYIGVGFFPAYFQTLFGYSQSKANSLGNWIWAFDALALVIVGYISDKVRVRKPFMVIGAIGAIVMTTIFAMKADEPDTSYTSFVVIVSLLAVFLGIAYAPWMASFTETVERHNPALAATGLAVWGLVIRIVVALTVFLAPHLVNTVTTLVEKGGAAQSGTVPGFTAGENATVKAVAADPTIAERAVEIQTTVTKKIIAAGVSPATAGKLVANADDQAAQLQAVSEISKVPVKDVATIALLNVQHAKALAAAQAVDPTTRVGAVLGDKASQAEALRQVVAKLKVTPTQAAAYLKELLAIPQAQLALLNQSGEAVIAAKTKLVTAATLSKSDQAFLGKYAPLAEPKVQSYLKDIQKAQHDSPKQWQHYFYVAIGGQIVFIPLIFLLAGPWSPKRARKEEREHEEFVERELEKLRS